MVESHPSVRIWGLVAEPFDKGEIGIFLSRTAELVTPIQTDGESRFYPYRQKNGEWSSSKVTEPSEFESITSDLSAVELGGVTKDRRPKYEHIPMLVKFHAVENVSLFPAYELVVSGDYFAPDASSVGTTVEEHVSRTIEFATIVYGLLDVNYSYGYSQVGARQLNEHPDRDALATGEIPFVDWLVILPPHLVDSLGREHVLDAPAWRAIELDDGSICLVSHENPTEQGIAERERVTDHLRRVNSD
jgi:hypothetical protein